MALLTPETVPFRLTRDMVDGMGLSGTNGPFLRCCEETLNVLRLHTSSLLTVLDVFMHDPLYRWQLSPFKALSIQQSKTSHLADSDPSINNEAGTEAAVRALGRIKHKLQGYEDSNGHALSVEGQVKRLVREAQDPNNLCRLFPGWAPWI